MTALRDFIQAHPRLAVLTGAGVSTSSGIPDYRDEQGEWKRARPVEFRPFMTDPRVRQRYWARSAVGWPVIRGAKPNGAHRALARLEDQGFVQLLITQNVDGLHAAAGSRNVIDLHGRLDTVRCMQGDHPMPRAELQQRLLASNPGWAEIEGRVAPDGDVDSKAATTARSSSPTVRNAAASSSPTWCSSANRCRATASIARSKAWRTRTRCSSSERR
jgi:hypothetical protein